MNEEEKKARAFLRFYVRDIKDEYFDRDYHIDKKFAETILNLIEKQQKVMEARLKEIESLYKMMSAKDERIERLMEMINRYNDMQYIRKIEEKYISKDKIKEIISKYVDIEEHLVYHHQELWGTDLAEMIKELLGE